VSKYLNIDDYNKLIGFIDNSHSAALKEIDQLKNKVSCLSDEVRRLKECKDSYKVFDK